MIAILDVTSGSQTLLAKICQMLHSNAAMKVINEKKGIFSFYSLKNMNKNFHENLFHYSGLNVLIKSVDNQ